MKNLLLGTTITIFGLLFTACGSTAANLAAGNSKPTNAAPPANSAPPANTAKADDSKSDAAPTGGDQDFSLDNQTGVEIHALYVSPHEEDEWGEDILGRDTLANSGKVDIKFSPKEKAKFWDLRVEDSGGNFIVWEKLNLLEISTVRLNYKDGKATALVE